MNYGWLEKLLRGLWELVGGMRRLKARNVIWRKDEVEGSSGGRPEYNNGSEMRSATRMRGGV